MNQAGIATGAPKQFRAADSQCDWAVETWQYPHYLFEWVQHLEYAVQWTAAQIETASIMKGRASDLIG
jgi:hypothetical protein